MNEQQEEFLIRATELARVILIDLHEFDSSPSEKRGALELACVCHAMSNGWNEEEFKKSVMGCWKMIEMNKSKFIEGFYEEN